MARPLDGIRVVDLSRVLAGPYCTMVLSDLGADVIKVEHTGMGDRARGLGPFIEGRSAYFLSVNRGKRSMVLDIFNPKGREILVELVKRSDVLVENFVPGTMARLGLDYNSLKAHNPRLVYTAVSGFGQTGPYASKPALDIIVQAMAGMLSITGEPGGRPVRPGASLGDVVAGLFAAIGVLAALRERQTSGQGQMVDIGMVDCQAAIMENAFARYFATGEVPGPLGTRNPSATPFQAFQTADGWIVVAIIGGEYDRWGLFCAAIDRADLIEDPRFADGWDRNQNHQLLEPIIQEAMLKKTSAQWLEELTALQIPCGPVNRLDQVVRDPQVQHRGIVTEAHHETLGKLKTVNTPLRLSRTPARVEKAAPELGEHTEDVLRGVLGLGSQALDDLKAQGLI